MKIRRRKSIYRTLSRVLSASVIVLAAVVGISSNKRNQLPPESELSVEIEAEPTQKMIKERAFEFPWRGSNYVVHPVAEFEVQGLVVTRNDISAFADIYHTADSVDVVDVCLVWGENTSEDVYRGVEFWSQPFSCWYRPKERGAGQAFNNHQLSNTHVLAADEELAEQLNSINIGDQIRMRGKLVNYHPAGASEQLRKSSTRRDDTGNGACEVMYVDDLEIISRNNPGWNALYEWGKFLLKISLVAKLISFLLFPYLEFRNHMTEIVES